LNERLWLQVTSDQAGVLGNSGEHLWTHFLAVMEREKKSGQSGRESVLWEPDCLLTCQPIFNKAARRREALSDGHWLMQLQ